MKTLVLLPMNIESHEHGGTMIVRVRLEGYGEYRRSRWLILAEGMSWTDEISWLFHAMDAEDIQVQLNYLIPGDWTESLAHSVTLVLLTEKSS